ncbi:hypothetical protein HanXRQr2_Chr11g0468921 [Helianthus annuus]|uniref:Uncharacterized protein n=1 Tax=Helianthus annuus TaxID=4232 RepID=A0A9K3MY73_HELAN|nr:hypothetical protein HanXRQr2_Chr11g0468921 [Helianthus annuus]
MENMLEMVLFTPLHSLIIYTVATIHVEPQRAVQFLAQLKRVIVAGNFIRAIHTLAIHGVVFWSEAANLDSQCVCHGESEDVAFDIETATKMIKNRDLSKTAECGGFVLWQINPDMWYVELTLGASKVHASCNGRPVWRYTPWLGAYAAKWSVRSLRRALQGLEPE